MRQYKFRHWVKSEKRFEYYEDFLLIGQTDVTQWTGYLDRHGTEIYEGDVIGYVSEWGNHTVTSRRKVVRWIKAAGATGFNITNGDCYEVLGNIFENPEFLKDKSLNSRNNSAKRPKL